jgi:hypothetical protein
MPLHLRVNFHALGQFFFPFFVIPALVRWYSVLHYLSLVVLLNSEWLIVMADRGALFCASCGTVSMHEGDCPQCGKPLKKLGKIGAINESKRATQRLINNENYKACIGIPIQKQNSRRAQLFDGEDSDSYP